MSVPTSSLLTAGTTGHEPGASRSAAQHVQRSARTSGEYLSRAVYTTFYCASYGVTFPVVFLAHVVPGGLPVAAGIADGARAARIYVHGVQLSRRRMASNESHHNVRPADL